MRNIKLTIEYDGTNFNGWQLQNGKSRTVQGEIENALKTIYKSRLKVVGSGRTDSGVHALGQVANVLLPKTRMTTAQIRKALNANLPEDVCIRQVSIVRGDFHAQFKAKRKTYRYTVFNGNAPPAQQRDYGHYVPYKLNLAAMRQAAKYLAGKKDFRSFMASDPKLGEAVKSKNTVRTVTALTVKKKGEAVFIDIEANGFLYKMVRNIVGTLLDVGTGRLKPPEVREILQKKDRLYAGDTAPAKGLCLLTVTY